MPALPLMLAAFAIGCVLLQWQPTLPQASAWLFVALAIALIGALLRIRPKSVAAGIIAQLLGIAAAGMLGFGYATWRAEHRLADALPEAWEGVDIAVVGVIDDLPQVSDLGTRFAFAVERVETAGASVPDRLSLGWYAPRRKGGETEEVPVLAAGERWRIVVRLKRPHGNVNPHGFDVEAWMLENALRATGYVRNDNANARLASFAGRATDYVQRARSAVRDRIVETLPDAAYAGVIVALTIGEQRAIPEAQWRIFNRTGITHLISISGLHVTVFAAIAGGVAYLLARRSAQLTSRVPARKLAALVGVIAATMYVLLAGAQVPAVRTLVMLVVSAFGLWLARPGTAALVWLWALAAVLAWDPWAGFAPGFWLSFGAVGLLLYTHAGRLASPAPASRAARALRALRAATRAQVLVTIGLVPGTLVLFQQISLISPLANALAIPAVTFIVVPLALVGIVVPASLPFAAAHAVFAALMVPLAWLSTAPSAVWQQHAPLTWTIAVAVIGIAWLAAPRGVPGRALGLLMLSPMFVVRPPAPGPGAFTMTVLDVGQGLAVVVQTSAHALLYDTGPRFTDAADAGNRVIAPFLRAAGIRRLGGMIVTHQDSDHSGGAMSILQTVPVGWLASSLPEGNAILEERAQDGGVAVRCLAGQRWEWDGVRFAILQPPAALYDAPRVKPNDLSCVVRIDSEHGSALLTGDLEARGEQELVRQNADAIKADVLLIPHHGSLTSSTPAFIAAVAPEFAVYTPGYRNRFGHPRPEVVARYDAARVRTFRTDYDGALTFTFAQGTSRLPRAERERDPRYWRNIPVREGTSSSD
jgi:competence protein ComEC